MAHASAPPHEDVAIRSAAPTFLVADVADTARWYSANLGFDTVGAVPQQEPYVFASLMRGPAEIMLLALADYEKPDLRDRRPAGLWDAYIRVDGVYALYQSVEGKPFIQMPLKHQAYGDWEFEVRDSNGYVLVFGGAY
jgi:catechol 2,3-dioxygenase-like lactoylglutathione lyase family enzyme